MLPAPHPAFFAFGALRFQFTVPTHQSRGVVAMDGHTLLDGAVSTWQHLAGGTSVLIGLGVVAEVLFVEQTGRFVP